MKRIALISMLVLAVTAGQAQVTTSGLLGIPTKTVPSTIDYIIVIQEGGVEQRITAAEFLTLVTSSATADPFTKTTLNGENIYATGSINASNNVQASTFEFNIPGTVIDTTDTVKGIGGLRIGAGATMTALLLTFEGTDIGESGIYFVDEQGYLFDHGSIEFTKRFGEITIDVETKGGFAVGNTEILTATANGVEVTGTFRTSGALGVEGSGVIQGDLDVNGSITDGELDPQVGTITDMYLPVWDGSALVDSMFLQGNGRIRIGGATDTTYGNVVLFVDDYELNQPSPTYASLVLMCTDYAYPPLPGRGPSIGFHGYQESGTLTKFAGIRGVYNETGLGALMFGTRHTGGIVYSASLDGEGDFRTTGAIVPAGGVTSATVIFDASITGISVDSNCPPLTAGTILIGQDTPYGYVSSSTTWYRFALESY